MVFTEQGLNCHNGWGERITNCPQNGEVVVSTSAMCDALIAELEVVQDKTGA
jgi:hypothetical protein